MNYREQLEQLKQASRARRVAHPDWPSHRQVLIAPGGIVEQIIEVMPLEKLIAHEGYCKYCYETHDNWWLMDQNDYQVDGLTIILCGECGYTSAAEFNQ
jgi:hypothetical protein